MQKICIIMLFQVLHLSTFVVFAKSMDATQNRYVVGVDFGLSFSTTVGHETSFPLGYSTFHYGPSHTGTTPAEIGVFIGKMIPLSTRNLLQVALNYDDIAKIKVNGGLEQGVSPPFYPFRYDNDIKSSQLLIEGKLLHQVRDLFYPYFTAGLGAGFNQAKDYATNIPPYLTLTPNYANKSTTSFSYMLGLGLDVSLFQSLTVGFGYRFSDLGTVKLGDGQLRNVAIINPMNSTHLYLNTLLLQLIYFF
ncbi:MAG: outer membrane beta-barrel protein [Legionellales bacterium]|nr:outer membrane beta-barrel protein [Legionellales bacterium]